MSEVVINTFSPAAGMSVPLPTDVGRVETERDNRGVRGSSLVLSVIGTGDTEEHVVLREDFVSPANVDVECGTKATELEGEAQVLTADPLEGTLWYCIPERAYGGDSR